MKTTFIWVVLLGLIGFSAVSSKTDEKVVIDQLLDSWHQAAAKADFNGYFDPMADNFIFLGTDPKERWTKSEFAGFCKPYFDKGKGWDFKKIERQIEISRDGKTAWFDEKIDTWMRDCRGSGVLIKQGKNWKLTQYNLAVLIENDKIQDFIKLRDFVKE